MTARIYSNESSDTLRLYRGGEVGNGLSSNNYYHSEFTTASGEIYAWDGSYSYQGPTQGDLNRLYGRLVEEVRNGGKAELLTAAAEWKSSLEMITRRALWLAESYKHFRRFDLPAVVRTLSKPVGRPATTYELIKNERGFASSRNKRARRNRYQGITDGWLEYWMGWAPAVGDIQNACDVLSREFPRNHISTAIRYEHSSRTPYKESWRKGFEAVTRKGVVGCYADAEVTNYNLFLSNQLGLLNPFLTGFQIIPFSFVVNWAINVEQFLGHLTDFAGVTLSNTGMGIKETREGHRQLWYLEWVYEGGTWSLKWLPHHGKTRGETKFRIPGKLPTPELVVEFDRLSLTRAATAVSLLVEVFLRK